MATTPNAMLIAISSPYARKGALYAAYKKYFGADSNRLVWQADTLTRTPKVDRDMIDEATAEDAKAAAAEYGATFREDLESFVSRDVLDCAREWLAPPNPSEVVAEAAELIRSCNCRTVTGDR